MNLIKIIFLLFTIFPVIARPDYPCSNNIIENGLTTDMIRIADQVSGGEEDVFGKCGSYRSLITCNGIYDTRMRIYEMIMNNNMIYIIVFRPTQQTPIGGDIHVNRELIPTSFLISNNRGRVHHRFQEAFINLYDQCKHVIDIFNNNSTIYITGHSLGGAFALFMSAKLYYDYNLTSKVYSFAGTFIGNKEYTEYVQNNIKENVEINLVETVDKNNWDNFDGTTEYYNTPDNSIYIDHDMICAFYVEPLKDSYGMHDIKNYYSAVKENRICWLN
jgi:hypothetical protein